MCVMSEKNIGISILLYSALKNSVSPISSTSRRQGLQVSLCLELSFDYDEESHPLNAEIQGCYPLTMSEKRLRAMLEDFLMEKMVELFGFQVIPLITDSGIWYENGEIREGRAVWEHGNGITKEETFTIDL